MYGVVLSVLLVAAGGALILACLSIYRSPEGTFSRETIAAAFGRIAVLVYIAVGVVLGGAVLSFLLPAAPSRVKPRREDGTILRKLHADYDLSALSPEASAAIGRERGLRKKLTVVAASISVLCAVPPLVWIFLPGHFGAGDKNREILVASAVVLGCFAVAMLVSFAVGLGVAVSCRRERAALKLAIADRSAVKRENPAPCRPAMWDKPAVLWAVRGSILTLAVVFIVLGIGNGGMRDVFAKAVRICTECIGLG